MKEVIDGLNESYDFLKINVFLEDKILDVLFTPRLRQPVDNTYLGIYSSRTDFLGLRTDKSIFNASLFILHIYTVFEVFIDNIISEYIKTINSNMIAFSDLPETIIDNHKSLSIKLLQSLDYYTHLSLTEGVIITNMLSVADKKDDCELNFEAYSIHSSNYRTKTLKDQFDKLGIKLLESIATVKEYQDFNRINGLSFNASQIDFLDQLVEDRNSIIHGWRLDNVPQSSEIIALINRVAALSNAIYSVVENHLVNFFLNSRSMTPICDIVPKTFRNGTVSQVFLYSNIAISNDDRLLYAILDDSMKVRYFKIVRIVCIQRHYTPLSYIKGQVDIEIGIETDNPLISGGRFYRYSGDLDEIEVLLT